MYIQTTNHKKKKKIRTCLALKSQQENEKGIKITGKKKKRKICTLGKVEESGARWK